jgi:hypothetical protein
MVIEVFAAESVLLRTRKYLQGTPEPPHLWLDLARGWCRRLPETIDRLGSAVLAAAVEGDMLHTQLAALKKLTRWIPYNSVALKRRVAAAALEVERYPLC